MRPHMRVNGKEIAEKISEELRKKIKELKAPPALAVFYIGQNSVTDSFVATKEKFAEKVGAKLEVFRFEDGATKEETVGKIKEVEASGTYQGIIVQLPLPVSFNAEEILDAVSPKFDVDVLSSKSIKLFKEGKLNRLPTVPAAIKEIFVRNMIDFKSKKIAVLGKGKLVGRPVISWLEIEGVRPTVFERGSDLGGLINFDIVISGMGAPHSIKPKMIKNGAILVDAGTSEQAGKVVGDFDPKCEEIASLFTPVPGGIGPITVAIIFRNLIA